MCVFCLVLYILATTIKCLCYLRFIVLVFALYVNATPSPAAVAQEITFTVSVVS